MFFIQEIEVSNLLCLYGVHQRFLNNAMQRYKEGLIKDFFRFVYLWLLFLSKFFVVFESQSKNFIQMSHPSKHVVNKLDAHQLQ